MFDQDQGFLTGDKRQEILTKPDFLLSLMIDGEYLKILDIFKEIDTTVNNFFILAMSLLRLGHYGEVRNYLKDVKALVKENPLAHALWSYFWSYYRTYGEGKVDEAIEEAIHALKLLDDANEEDLWILKREDIVGKLNTILGASYNIKLDLTKARSHLMVAKELFEKNNSYYDYSIVVHFLGIIEFNQGNYDEALEYYEEALAYREQIGNSIEMSFSFNAIGLLHVEKGELSTAFDYLHNALELLKGPGSCTSILSVVHKNLGYAELRRGRLSKSLEYYGEALNLQKDLDNPALRANTLSDMACVQRLQADTQSALENLKEAKAIYNSYQNKFGLAHVVKISSLIYKEKGLYQKAREGLKNATNLFSELGYDSAIAYCLLELALIEYRLGERSIRESIEPFFPHYQSNTLIQAYHAMIRALIDQQEKNYGSAMNRWTEILTYNLPYLERITCYEALIELALQDWQSHPTDENLHKVLLALNKLESESYKENLIPTTCKIYLVKAKIDQTKMNLSGAKKWVNKCLELAEKYGLPGHTILAGKEFERINTQERRLQEEIITSIAQKTDENPETVKTYFQSFLEELTKNTPQMKQQPSKKTDIVKISAKKMETVSQTKKILKVLEENPLGVYQKDLPEMVDLSKATVSRRLNELLNQGTITSTLKERTRLIMLKIN